jgi:hypothetical protein
MSDEDDSDGGGGRQKAKEPMPPHKIRMTDMQDVLVEKVIRCKYPQQLVLLNHFHTFSDRKSKQRITT